MFSMTITAPSTMMPKSIAPSESRLAGMPTKVRPINVASNASGMMAATINAARRFPQEQEQHQRDQHRAFDQVGKHGLECLLDQP